MTAVTLDLSQSRTIPFGRLLAVELRKAVDTRAGRWLLIATAVVIAVTVAIVFAVVLTQDLSSSFRDFMLAVNVPMGVFLPILGVMTVTSEWSQRTGLVTFTQVPSRLTVIAAKFGAVSLMALAAVALGVRLAGSRAMR
jgi:ABC-2 type transport system permease protein